MSKHTPGPWTQWADTNIVVRMHTGRPHAEDLRICEVATNTWKDEGRHNARLIAAAPDLLEALQNMNKWLFNTGYDENHPWRISIETAITKATGAKP